jgi:hypothetical protein
VLRYAEEGTSEAEDAMEEFMDLLVDPSRVGLVTKGAKLLFLSVRVSVRGPRLGTSRAALGASSEPTRGGRRPCPLRAGCPT